jgi:hypothetical protein
MNSDWGTKRMILAPLRMLDVLSPQRQRSGGNPWLDFGAAAL